MSGRHRPAGPGGRRVLRTPLTVVAVASLVAVTAVAVRMMAAGAEGCSNDGVTLPVAAAPEIAPAIQEAATEWAKTDPNVNGKCITVEVRSVAAADVAAALAVRGGSRIDVAAKPIPTPNESEIPAVWVPDSTAWLGRVTAVDRSALGSPAPSLAMSPVVFALPESVARSLAPTLGASGGEGLLRAALADAQKAITEQRPPQLTVGMVDPRRDTAGLVGAMIVRDAVVTDETKVPNLIAVYRLLNRARAADTVALQKAFGQGVKAAPMSEQAVLAFNGTNPPAPLTVVPLTAGSPALDYPYVSLSGNPREVETAASKFRTALTGLDYQAPFTRLGFRLPDGTSGPGFPIGHGITAAPASASPLADPGRVAQTLGLWRAANSPSRALAIIDISASMAAPLGTGTRLSVTKEAATLGLSLFTDTSALGIWTMSTDHAEASPILQLSPANRAVLNQRIGAIQTTGPDQSMLFATVRDAYKVMTEQHNPEVANRIIVLTDGKGTPSPDLKNLEQLNRALENISVVTKPIEVTLIGVGPDVDRAELEEIARITGGVATYINSPAEIQSVFLKALLD